MKCAISLSGSSAVLEAAGGMTSVAIGAQPECAWTASADVGWVTELSPASGQGNGQLQFRVMPNPDGQVRQGVVVINDERLQVRQEAAPCNFTVTVSRDRFDIEGGAATVSISAPNGCTWTAASTASWIRINGQSSGSGSGSVAVQVSANSGGERAGEIAVGGQVVSISQESAIVACVADVDPRDASMPASGGTATISVELPPGCAWTATSGDRWITIVNGASGRGNGSVTFRVAANDGPSARSGTLSIAGQTVNVEQAGTIAAACTYTATPSTHAAASSGSSGSVAVVTAATCAWTATTGESWIAITSGASQMGSGSAGFSVAPNTGPARTGTLTVAGRIITVNQAAAPAVTCTFVVTPTTHAVVSSGGSGAVAVVTGPDCAWTATTSADWISITSGASQTGSGSAGFSAAPNTGAARSGSLTVAGRTVTVNQAAAPVVTCTYTVSPTTLTAASTGSTGTVAVSTGADCAWTAAANAGWLSITSGSSGSGDGSVAFTAAANTGGARSGTLTVAGRTVTVEQAGAAPQCSYSISPSSQSVPGTGGSGTVSVSTTSGCSWRAESNAGWLTITSGASGNGSGSVAFTANDFNGNTRTGTLTIATQTFTVTQTRCSFSISPTQQSVLSVGGALTVSVSTTNGCAWTASTNAQWITITSGSQGSGSGSVLLLVLPNLGGARSGTVTIAGQTFTANQSALLGTSTQDASADSTAGVR